MSVSKITWAISPLSWSNDDLPSMGGDCPLEVCLDESKKAGYSAVELGNKFPRDEKILGPLLQSHGLSLASGWFSGNLLTCDVPQEIERLQSHLKLLRSLGAKVMVYAETTGCIHGVRNLGLQNTPKLTSSEIRKYAQKLSKVAEYLESEGVRLAYHHHMGTVIETQDDIECMLEASTDAVGLTLDTGHLYFAGGNFHQLWNRFRDRIFHLHFKDVRDVVLRKTRNTQASFLDAVIAGVFTVPGDGSLDFGSYLESIVKDQYDGMIVVEAEQDPSVAPSFFYAKSGLDHLEAEYAKALRGGKHGL